MRLPRLFALVICAAILVIIPRSSSARRLGVSNTPDNQPPIAENDHYTRHGGGTIGPVLENDHDPEMDPMTASLITTPSHGSLSGLDGNSFTYEPTDPSFTGDDSFTYQACDNHSNCSNVALVTITINNQAPVAVPDQFRLRANTSIVSRSPNQIYVRHQQRPERRYSS
jgi:hypothetical protein